MKTPFGLPGCCGKAIEREQPGCYAIMPGTVRIQGNTLSVLGLGHWPVLMAEDEFDLDILLKLQHALADVTLRHPRCQKLIGKPAAFGPPECDRIRAVSPAEFTGAALDIGSSGSGGKSNHHAFTRGGGAAGHFSSHRTQVPLILFVVYGTMVNAFYRSIRSFRGFRICSPRPPNCLVFDLDAGTPMRRQSAS
ncbi:UNVERIFIED_ORG: hypothetical protein GGI57_003945 [Rhizobium aethiopicum]